MLFYDLKLAFRRLMKNRIFTLVNISGFAIGFAACMILALFLYHEYTVDKDIPNYPDIYRLIDARKNSTRMDYDISKMLTQNYPEIKSATPLNYTSFSSPVFLKHPGQNDYIFAKSVISTTNRFFDIFSLHVIAGNSKTPFTDLNSVIVTRSTAEKLFGSTDIIGEALNIGDKVELSVSAVVEDMPENSSLDADIFMNSENENFRFSQYCSNGECYNPVDQYIMLNDQADAPAFQNYLNNNFPLNKSETDSVYLQPLAQIYLTPGIEDNENKSGNRNLLFILLTITISIIVLSIINYVNYSLSNQLSTLRELGIKIATGAGLTHLRRYYITEVALSVLVSFGIALLLVKAALPFTQNLLDTSLDMYGLLTTPLLIIFVSIFLIVTLVSSLAPLYIISRFDIQKLLGKGRIKIGSQKWKNILTTFQVTVSIILIICLISIDKQLAYAKTTNLGFDKEHLLRLNVLDDDKNIKVLKQYIDDYSFVKSSSLSAGAPGMIRLGMGSNSDEGEPFMMQCMFVDDLFLNTMGIHLLKGRAFMSSDLNRSCYINETAYKRYGWEDLNNRKFNNGREGGYDVVGVVNDFHIASLHSHIEPVCLIYQDEYSVLNIRLLPGNLDEQMAKLKEEWAKIWPDSPMSYTFYDQYFDSLYRKEDRQGKAITLFAIIASIITALGIFSQIVQSAIIRTKEIGIRKVNGAKIKEVMIMLNKDFVKWVIIAFIIACPVAWYAMHKWLQ
ncbi:MAG TPA: ABC transporter permease, partial [Bacteroidales bacterium]|nr:ABC transporter permease [Bacteroidales bacterium]